MRNLISGTQFRRDVKLAQRRGKDMSKLRELNLLLGQGGPITQTPIALGGGDGAADYMRGFDLLE